MLKNGCPILDGRFETDTLVVSLNTDDMSFSFDSTTLVEIRHDGAIANTTNTTNSEVFELQDATLRVISGSISSPEIADRKCRRGHHSGPCHAARLDFGF